MVMRNLGGLGSDMAGLARSTVAATGSNALMDPPAGTETPKEVEDVAGPIGGAVASGGAGVAERMGDSKGKKKKKGKGKK
jgi:hypothetical protein